LVETKPVATMEPESFAYFMVRIRVQVPSGPAGVAGVVERLGTGRKLPFPDGEELLRLLADWSHTPPKMGGADPTGNAAETGSGRP
jgi:hypothetical protein